jgi:hypothetical protein
MRLDKAIQEVLEITSPPKFLTLFKNTTRTLKQFVQKLVRLAYRRTDRENFK